MAEVNAYPQAPFLITSVQETSQSPVQEKTTVMAFGEDAGFFNGVDAVATSSYQGVSRIFCGSNTGDAVFVFLRNETTKQYEFERKDGTRGGDLGGFETDAKAYLEVAGIAVNDQAGEYYVIDQSHQRINVYDIVTGTARRSIDLKSFYPNGYDAAKATPLPTEYFSPQGIAFNEGSLYVSENGWPQVFKMTVEGQRDATFRQQPLLAGEGGTAYLMQEPECVAVYEDKLFVADENNKVVRVFNATTGELQQTFGANIFAGDIEGLSVYRHRLFAMDEASERIQVFDVDTLNYLGAFALAGDSVSGNFADADGLAITQQGEVVVADQKRNRVLVFGVPAQFVEDQPVLE